MNSAARAALNRARFPRKNHLIVAAYFTKMSPAMSKHNIYISTYIFPILIESNIRNETKIIPRFTQFAGFGDVSSHRIVSRTNLIHENPVLQIDQISDRIIARIFNKMRAQTDLPRQSFDDGIGADDQVTFHHL